MRCTYPATWPRRVLPAGRRGAALAVCMALSACGAGCQHWQLRGAGPLPEPRVIARSVEGRPIEAYALGTGTEAVLVLATIHGNEAAGATLARRLIDELRAQPALLRERRVIVVPVANPDGLARGTRANARGVDLNRNFPATNFAAAARHGTAPLSEPESQALDRLLREVRPVRVVSIHQPLGCVDYDGPAAELAEAIAAQAGLPVRRLGSLPGSMGSYIGMELGIPLITLELPRGASRWPEDELWARYRSAMLTAVSSGHGGRPAL